jgi:YVTN family beta-propeller protein
MSNKIIIGSIGLVLILLAGGVLFGCAQLQKTELKDDNTSLTTHDPYLLVANSNSSNITVINTLKASVETTIQLNENPWAVAFNKNQNKWYVTTKSSIIVIRNTDLSKEATISVPGMSLTGIVLNSSGTIAYVVDAALEDVSFMDLNKDDSIKRVTVGTTPVWIAISPDEQKLYVTNYYSSNVSIIDIVIGSLEANVGVGLYPYGLAINPNNGKILIANAGSKSVSIINSLTKDVETTVSYDFTPSWISVASGESKAYMADSASNNIFVVDLDTLNVLSIIELVSKPTCMDFNTDKTKLFVSHSKANAVSVVNTQTKSIEAVINVGEKPIGLCYEQ